jgi:16S rRNA (cytidine1402-2'-O)-methyltransferase
LINILLIFVGMKRAILYLIPSTLGDTPAEMVLPNYNNEIILSLKHFLVEDLRSARRFLKKTAPQIVIDELSFTELNEHTTAIEMSDMLRVMEDGQSMGIISEAGCPAVADPGAEVVAMAHRKGYKVAPLVGPSSVIMSLMASGLNGQSFAFNGYLPVEAPKRAERIKALELRTYAEGATQIFIETPYRNSQLFDDLLRHCRPSTMLCLACNISCRDEFILTMTVKDWAAHKPDLHKKPAIFLLGAGLQLYK